MNIKTYHNAGYYIAEFDEPDNIILDVWGHSWFPEGNEWCTKTFGESDVWGAEPVNGWKRMRNKYFFTEQKKLNWFVLRWGGAHD